MFSFKRIIELLILISYPITFGNQSEAIDAIIGILGSKIISNEMVLINSCNLKIKPISNLIKSQNILMFKAVNGKEEMNETFENFPTIVDLQSCKNESAKSLQKRMTESGDSESLWIIVHENSSTTFPTKLNQNIIHFVSNTGEYLEWIKYKDQFEMKEVIGGKMNGIKGRIPKDNLMGTTLKIGVKEMYPGVIYRDTENVANMLKDKNHKLYPLEINVDVYGESIGKSYYFVTKSSIYQSI